MRGEEDLLTMEEAQAEVPEELKNWISDIWKAIAKRKVRNMKYIKDLGKASKKTIDAVKDFYGKNVSKQIIKPENLLHIYDRHGKYPKTEIKNGQIPINAQIAVLIPDILTNPSDVKKGEPTNKMGYETIILSKEYADGSVHVVNAILKNNVLEIYTMYAWSREKTEKKALGEQERNSSVTPKDNSAHL